MRSVTNSGRRSGKQRLHAMGVAAWHRSREGRFSICPSAMQMAIISCKVMQRVACGAATRAARTHYIPIPW